MNRYPKSIEYSPKYSDEEYEYRNISLPQHLYKQIKGKNLLKEVEWRLLGVKGNAGWMHYGIYLPEPNILLLRRSIAK